MGKGNVKETSGVLGRSLHDRYGPSQRGVVRCPDGSWNEASGEGGMRRLVEIRPKLLCLYSGNWNDFSQFELEISDNVSDQLGLIFRENY